MAGGNDKAEMTDAEKAMIQVSAEKYDTGKKAISTIMPKLQSQVDQYGSEGYQAQVGMNATAATNDSLTNAVRANLRGLSSNRGINPASQSFKNTAIGMNNIKSGAEADAGMMARQNAQKAYVNGVGNVLALADNQDTSTMQSMAQQASDATDTAINNAYNDWNNSAGLQSAATQGIGMYYGSRSQKSTSPYSSYSSQDLQNQYSEYGYGKTQ